MILNKRILLLKIIAGRLVDLGEFMKTNPNNFDQMAKLDQESFAKYRDTIGDYAQNKYDLMDDFDQDGLIGVGVEGDTGLEGHVYGYTMSTDNLPDFDPDETTTQDMIDEFGARFYSIVPENFPKILYSNIEGGKVFYVSNFVLERHRTKIIDVLKTFLTRIKSSGYKYITFDALSDSFKLFMNPDLSPKTERLSKFGLKLIALIPDEDSGMSHAQALIEL